MNLTCKGLNPTYLAVLVSLIFLNVNVRAQTTGVDWQNPSLVDLNKGAPHASFFLYDKKEDALAENLIKSTFYKSLNGDWRFLYTDNYKNRPQDFYAADFNDAQWKMIP